ncbi:MAG: class I adenylate-forming enzyme family protein [Actinophytocola sp.]|uniref:class I adenylate-forming enzyme family protein n=1 Tax=Actinophytocola sp. TaxID=1872138 RepID=UPI003D6C442A
MSVSQSTEQNLLRRVNVGDMLTRTAARSPGALALVDGRRRWTWRELDARVNQIAHGLIRDGYRPDDRIAVMSGNTAEFLITYYACAKAGVVAVPINLGWNTDQTAYVLRHSGVTGIVVAADLLGAALDAIREVDTVTDVIVVGDEMLDIGRRCRRFDDLAADREDAPAVVIGDDCPVQCLYTGGTTSRPKGVLGSHLAVYLESLAIAVEWSFSDRDRLACMMPLFHTAQLNLFCTPAVAVGATMVLLPSFDAARLLDTIEEFGVTIIFGLPMMYRELLGRDDITTRDVSTLRLAVYGMAPMPADELRRAIELLGCDLSLMFGQTEMSPVTTIFRPEHQLSHSGAVGTPTVNTQVAIMDYDGGLLESGRTGEIVYRGPQLMNGYLDDDAATADACRNGWFHSGDLGHFDDDGILWFDDRTKDVIKTGGENVASIEVELALYAAEPAIREVAVIGLPHERWGEAITAVAVPRPGHQLDGGTIRHKVKAHLDGFKVPKDVIVRAELPKTSTGKVQKNLLRQEHAAHYSG